MHPDARGSGPSLFWARGCEVDDDNRRALGHQPPMATKRRVKRPATAFLIKGADMAARSLLEAAMRPWRLSLGQMLLVGTIERLGQASAVELARALHLTPQAMTTLLRPLEERGVITRKVDPTNRRRLSLSLSEPGYALFVDVRRAAERVDADLTANLSEAELDEFRRLLVKISSSNHSSK